MPIVLLTTRGGATQRLLVSRESPRSFHVLNHGKDLGSVTITAEGDHGRLRNDSPRPVRVNGAEVMAAELRPGDVIEIGQQRFTVELAGPKDGRASARSGGESNRRLRAISASMPARTDDKPDGLLRRMGNALRPRARADATREKALQAERRQLLEDIGRLAVSGSLFGPPDAFFSALSANRPAMVDPSQVPPAMVERWRESVQRLSLVEAEITGLRRALGLGADPARAATPQLRASLRAREEQVFAALDDQATSDLDCDLGMEPPPGERRKTR